MLASEDGRRLKAVHKAQRNARARERRRRVYAVSWQRFRRCTGCGRWVSESGTSGHGGGARFCEGCVLGLLLRGHGRAAA